MAVSPGSVAAASEAPLPVGDAVLECRGLTKRYGDRTVVDDVGFSIAPGETYGLLGPNGAGKTTTISMLCGLLHRDAGTVRVLDRDLDAEPRSVQGSIGYVPQNLAIYPDLSPVENLRFFGRLHGLRGAALAARIDDVLETIGLTERADDRADEFSGGMKRRLNIGIGLLHEPSLLILDEPTVGVDPQSRDAILASVDQLGATGIAVLYTTHYMEEAERLCDRVGIVDHGRMVAEGTRRELVALVGEHDHVRLSLESGVEAAAERLRTAPGVVKLTSGDHTLDLSLAEAHRALPSILSAVNDVGARVLSVEVVEPDLEAVFMHLTGRALRN
ncbi:ATP-binding cassette domain-containing protein [Ilumatobacter sp.]|uniref:ABC transporter ATP-binding protein n=1 Tax=Ilumatobacter sp. TaxID=1967498 RepID=UPI003AF75D09